MSVFHRNRRGHVYNIAVNLLDSIILYNSPERQNVARQGGRRRVMFIAVDSRPRNVGSSSNFFHMF